jgi:serine/threonine-protein kinase
MAPEQARGKACDKRADIWTFGVVLYEMLTGTRLFAGETISDTLAAVLTKDPVLDRVPPPVRKLLQRCLCKDPKERLRDIGEVRFLLDDATGARTALQRYSWLRWTLSVLSVAALAWIGL